MSKKYNLGKRSDMRKFQKEFETAALDKAKQIMMSKSYEIECPGCKSKLNVSSGIQLCPSCGSKIEFTLNPQGF